MRGHPRHPRHRHRRHRARPRWRLLPRTQSRGRGREERGARRCRWPGEDALRPPPRRAWARGWGWGWGRDGTGTGLGGEVPARRRGGPGVRGPALPCPVLPGGSPGAGKGRAGRSAPRGHGGSIAAGWAPAAGAAGQPAKGCSRHGQCHRGLSVRFTRLGKS